MAVPRESPAALRARWRTSEGAVLARRVLTRLASTPEAGAPDWGGLPLGTIDGRVDLRGLTPPHPWVATEIAEELREPAYWPRLLAARVHDVDVSFAATAHAPGAPLLGGLTLLGCDVRNCRFDGADLRAWSFAGSTVHDCSFTGADLRGTGLGSGTDRGEGEPRSDWRRCDLTGARFSPETRWAGSRFVDVLLLDGRWSGHSDFDGAVFERCTFGGPLREATFCDRDDPDDGERNDLVDCDLSRAPLTHVQFVGMALRSVVWPAPDGDRLFFSPFHAVARRLVAALPSPDDVDATALAWVLEHDLSSAHPDREVGHVYLPAVTENTRSAERIRRLVQRCEREAGGPAAVPRTAQHPALPPVLRQWDTPVSPVS